MYFRAAASWGLPQRVRTEKKQPSDDAVDGWAGGGGRKGWEKRDMDIVFTCEGVRRKLYISVLKRNKIFRTRCYISARLGGARWGGEDGRTRRSPRV